MRRDDVCIDMRRTDIYLTERQYDLVKEISQEREITFSEMFRRIIDNYLEEVSCLNAKTVEKEEAEKEEERKIKLQAEADS